MIGETRRPSIQARHGVCAAHTYQPAWLAAGALCGYNVIIIRRFHTVTAAATVPLEPGRVYRTAHLLPWGQNPTRLARRLQAAGRLQSLGHGLLYAPRKSRFGEVPPTDEALLDAFLDGTPYVVTGPSKWNALGLGTTAVFAHPLVYNSKRTGLLDVGGRRFQFRQTAFPTDPPAEWFVVDLLQNAEGVASSAGDLEAALTRALRQKRYDENVLLDMATRYGRRREQQLVLRAVRAST
jgi:hypothetical protein